MKTEVRHELATNSLAKSLNVWGEKLRPHSSLILIVVAVVLALYGALSLWNSYSAGLERDAWTAFENALMAGDANYSSVQDVADSEEFSGSRVREWAYMAWADRQLRHASELYLYDRERAEDLLTSVAAIYDQFAGSASGEQLRNRARFGMARVSEMRNQLDEARRQYAAVEGPLSVIAAARLKEIEGKEAEETAQWLKTADLPRPKPPTGPGTAGARPGLETDMPPAEGATVPALDPARTMQDILGGQVGTDANDDLRYGEEPPAGEGADTDAASAPAAESAAADPSDDSAASPETPAPGATEPAGDAPSEDAPSGDGASSEAPVGSATPNQP
jgi:hypothetical protein